MRETGWLIERYWSRPMWLMLNTCTVLGSLITWTDDADRALRFAREKDAADFAEAIAPKECCLAKITEHVWVDGALSGKTR